MNAQIRPGNPTPTPDLAGPGVPTSDPHEPLGVERIRRWAELAAFAVDAGERERIDALLILGEELEDALAGEIALVEASS